MRDKREYVHFVQEEHRPRQARLEEWSERKFGPYVESILSSFSET